MMEVKSNKKIFNLQNYLTYMYNQFIFKFCTSLFIKSINEHPELFLGIHFKSATSITVNVQNHRTYMTF